MTILIVTHAIDEIEKYHHLVYLKNGVLRFTGNLKELFSSQNIPTYLIEGEGLEHFNTELSCRDDLQIIPRVNSIPVIGHLQFEILKIIYPNIIFNQIPIPYVMIGVSVTTFITNQLQAMQFLSFSFLICYLISLPPSRLCHKGLSGWEISSLLPILCA